MKLIFKKALPMLLVLALLVGVAAVSANAAVCDAELNGSYTAVVEKSAMGNPITYTCKMDFDGNGGYTYSVHILIPANPDSPMFGEGYDATETESGSCEVDGSSIAFSGGSFDTGVIVDENTVSVHGYISSFAAMSAMEDITLTKSTGEAYEDSLRTGTYYLGAEDYPEEAMMKVPAYIIINTEERILDTRDGREGKDLAPKGFGHYEFDETTGIYTVTYTEHTQATSSSFTFADDAITFVTPMGFGMAVINITDEDGNFIPYSAHFVSEEPPVAPTAAPAEPTEAPVQPTEAPVQPTEAPTEPTEAPAPTQQPAPGGDTPGAPATGGASAIIAGIAMLVGAGSAVAVRKSKMGE
ncbi:MAG: hypothetical protein II871_03010 [Clostridia bacterium]|nr:hypothetical protein [Clostridia bacterium]